MAQLGGFSSGVSHRVVVKILTVLQPSEALIKDNFPSKMAHPHGCQPKASVSYHEDLSIGLFECPREMAAGFSPRESDQKEAEATESFMIQPQKSYISHIHNILMLQRSGLFTVGGDYTRARIAGGRNNWGPSCILTITENYQCCSYCHFFKGKIEWKIIINLTSVHERKIL